MKEKTIYVETYIAPPDMFIVLGFINEGSSEVLTDARRIISFQVMKCTCEDEYFPDLNPTYYHYPIFVDDDNLTDLESLKEYVRCSGTLFDYKIAQNATEIEELTSQVKGELEKTLERRKATQLQQ